MHASKAIWRRVFSLYGLNREVLGWNGELVWALRRLKGKALITNLLKVGWSAFRYHIWKERNSRIFKQKKEDAEHILDHINTKIHYRFVGLSH